jgi:hypothetical protein
MGMQHGHAHAAWTCSIEWSRDQQHVHKVRTCRFPFNKCTSWICSKDTTCSMDMQHWTQPRHGHAAWTYSIEMQHRCEEWTWSIDMQHGHAAQGYSMDKQQGDASWSFSMQYHTYMQYGHAWTAAWACAWTCSTDVQHIWSC